MDLLLVAAGTERSLSGVDVRIRGVPHQCIGMVRRVGWSPNYIREEHARQAWKTHQELPGLLPALPALKRSSELRDGW